MMKFYKFYERGLVDKNKQNINEVKITVQECTQQSIIRIHRWLKRK